MCIREQKQWSHAAPTQHFGLSCLYQAEPDAKSKRRDWLSFGGHISFQSQYRQAARPLRPGYATRPHRRGDRIELLFAAVHRSRLALSDNSLRRKIWSLLE